MARLRPYSGIECVGPPMSRAERVRLVLWNESGHRVILRSNDSKKENSDDRKQQYDACP
ncbi:hypothetical protein [Nonomuraea bangladeshensis]|uniref:hypothetical protein n=1 Tax=Nonomuraea bangladeshensis TaxID=404385 RepID=UPI003C2E2664